MSKKGSHQIKGYFDYVVPPLEGFWWQEGIDGADYMRKKDFHWISVIRLPDFVTKEDLGAFDDEPGTMEQMDQYLQEYGYENDFGGGRLHHEIYLSDTRRVPQERWKTVIRHPVKKAGE